MIDAKGGARPIVPYTLQGRGMGGARRNIIKISPVMIRAKAAFPSDSWRILFDCVGAWPAE